MVFELIFSRFRSPMFTFVLASDDEECKNNSWHIFYHLSREVKPFISTSYERWLSERCRIPFFWSWKIAQPKRSLDDKILVSVCARCGDLFCGNETCCRSTQIMTKNNFNLFDNSFQEYFRNQFPLKSQKISENFRLIKNRHTKITGEALTCYRKLVSMSKLFCFILSPMRAPQRL